MKTIAVKTQGNESNNLAVLRKVSVNPAVLTKKQNRQPNRTLSIQGYEMREWLEYLNNSEGVYFLDLEEELTNYSLHLKHNPTGKLMELECKETNTEVKDILEGLIFDLSLFPETPILTVDSNHVETMLNNLADIYCEYRRAINDIIGRLVNIGIKQLFETGIYEDPRITEFTVDGIYHVLYPGTSRSFKEQASYGLYLVYLAVQNIFYQVIGKSVIL